MNFKEYANKMHLQEDSYAEEVSKYIWNAAIEEVAIMFPCTCPKHIRNSFMPKHVSTCDYPKGIEIRKKRWDYAKMHRDQEKAPVAVQKNKR